MKRLGAKNILLVDKSLINLSLTKKLNCNCHIFNLSKHKMFITQSIQFSSVYLYKVIYLRKPAACVELSRGYIALKGGVVVAMIHLQHIF